MKKSTLFIFLGIILIATVLRFWQLGRVPLSPDWDEVSLGYNAFSILHTGKDEYGKTLPIVLQSFGDYKPALYTYLTIPSIAVFGLTVFALRFPSAVFGILSVVFVFFLVRELFKKDTLALIASFLLAIAPWSLQFSRVAFETNVGVALNIFGALFFVKGLKKPWLFIGSAIIFALNIYVYQSEKIFTPLLVVLLICVFYQDLKILSKKFLISFFLVGIFVALPMILYTFFGTGGLARVQGVSILSSNTLSQTIANRHVYNVTHHDTIGLLLNNKWTVYGKTILANYLSHYDLNWLFITGDIDRHHAPDMGLLYLFELPAIGVGIYQLLFGKWSKKTKLLIFGWFLLAPLPAAITQDVPHAVRTMNFLPAYQIFAALGFLTVWTTCTKVAYKKIPWGALLLVLWAFLAMYNFVYYLDEYFVQQNYFYATDWQYGYEQVVADVKKLAPKYNTIIVDNKTPMDQSYIFFLFYLHENPASYQKQGITASSQIRHFGKYVFQPITWDAETTLKQTLFVGVSSDFPKTATILTTIKNPDGSTAFEIATK